jgi:hypothetical protein
MILKELIFLCLERFSIRIDSTRSYNILNPIIVMFGSTFGGEKLILEV